jgi:hypothetical protein
MTACNQSISPLLQDQEGELAAVPDTEHPWCLYDRPLNDITDLTARLRYRDLFHMQGWAASLFGSVMSTVCLIVPVARLLTYTCCCGVGRDSMESSICS